jgi:hypothetical protein
LIHLQRAIHIQPFGVESKSPRIVYSCAGHDCTAAYPPVLKADLAHGRESVVAK